MAPRSLRTVHTAITAKVCLQPPTSLWSSRILQSVRHASNRPSTPPSNPGQTPPAGKRRMPFQGVDLKAANSFVVNSLSSRPGPGAGAQHTRQAGPLQPGQELPPQYKPAARRVVSIIVALPIAIVTGYILWDRTFMGGERKKTLQTKSEEI